VSHAHRSVELNERGRALHDAGELDEALATYLAAAEVDPSNGHAWFNAALVAKEQRDWVRAVTFGERAASVEPDDYPTSWNLGIAATALGQWGLARSCWRRCGIEVPEGDGPIDLELGPVPVRLNPDTRPEVVWTQRLDPARARILNVPGPGSGRRFGDVVLHDGVPVGEREHSGRMVPVFDELERLEVSPLPTLEVHVTAPSPVDVVALEDAFLSAGLAAEDWSASVRALCESCSRGRVGPIQVEDVGWVDLRHVGLAADLPRARDLLSIWEDQARGRRTVTLEEAG
jgi:tetratricopeptide (TPR) repeat protein